MCMSRRDNKYSNDNIFSYIILKISIESQLNFTHIFSILININKLNIYILKKKNIYIYKLKIFSVKNVTKMFKKLLKYNT